MGTFNFECKKCKHCYEEMVPYDPKGKYSKVKCPECGSKSKTKLIAAPAFNFTNPEGTDRWNSDTSGHDYRFHHRLPKVLNERMEAEKKSHMGQTKDIYKHFDDFNSNGGRNFDPLR